MLEALDGPGTVITVGFPRLENAARAASRAITSGSSAHSARKPTARRHDQIPRPSCVVTHHEKAANVDQPESRDGVAARQLRGPPAADHRRHGSRVGQWGAPVRRSPPARLLRGPGAGHSASGRSRRSLRAGPRSAAQPHQNRATLGGRPGQLTARATHRPSRHQDQIPRPSHVVTHHEQATNVDHREDRDGVSARQLRGPSAAGHRRHGPPPRVTAASHAPAKRQATWRQARWRQAAGPRDSGPTSRAGQRRGARTPIISGRIRGEPAIVGRTARIGPTPTAPGALRSRGRRGGRHGLERPGPC